MEEVIIVGGGVAGLSCLNAFLDQHISPLLLESGVIGSPKMCGEFLAPQTIPILESWNITDFQIIHDMELTAKTKQLMIPFPNAAGGMSRSQLELRLAARAISLKGRIFENTKIINITPPEGSNPYLLQLDNGEIIQTKNIVFATGKVFKETSKITFPYYGFKIHFNKIVKPNTLFMFIEKNAYFGIVPISDSQSNLTCLLRKKELFDNSAQTYFTKILSDHPSLKCIFEDLSFSNIEWLEGQAPEFSKKHTPNWPNAYWIGDASISLPPAIGSGFAHAIESAVWAVKFYLENDTEGYKNVYADYIKYVYFVGKLFHYIFMHPNLSAGLFPLIKQSNFIKNKLLQKVHFSLF